MEIGILGRFDNDKKEEKHLRFATKEYAMNEMDPSKVLSSNGKNIHLNANKKGRD